MLYEVRSAASGCCSCCLCCCQGKPATAPTGPRHDRL